MLFNSFEFALFFPVVTLAYFLTPGRLRWITLLVASCVFYMAFIPAYLLILFAMILVDYVAGLVIERSRGTARTWALVVSLASNLGILGLFKYYDFFASTAASLGRALGWPSAPALLGIALPLGLSFHTFQAMAYTIEVYRGHQPAERHLGLYALYVMFYPQLVAGPIERPQHLLRQFRIPHRFDHRQAQSGLQLMAWGLFKKVVIADRLATVVNVIYAAPSSCSGPVLMLGTFLFAWQIYCDFSGYSDIAIGAAQTMGFSLMANFDRPYLARSVREFWTKWHISLSSWFRDYVYIPLGGRRCSTSRWAANLMLTFLLSGLWHGANWTFVVWGALNGLFLVAGIASAGARARLRHAVGLDRHPRLLHAAQTLTVFGLISWSWVFFRADNLSQSLYIVGHLGRIFPGGSNGPLHLGLSPGDVMLALALVAGLFAIEVHQPTSDPRTYLAGRPAWVRWSVYYALIGLTITLGVFTRSQFLYFQF